MKKRFSVRVLSLVVLFFALSNCHQDDLPLRSSVNIGKSDLTGAIPCVTWNWEGTSDYMQTLTPNTLLKPWASGSSILYDQTIRYDYKSADGWSLLYNNFDPTIALPGQPFFALYNKYRGMLRFYFWIPSNSYTTSNYLEEYIRTSGSSSSTTIFNAASQEITDPSVSRNFSESIKPYAIPSSGGWYVSQFQVAYDKDLSSKHYYDIGLLMDLKFWQITDEKLESTSVGSATGEIRSESSTLGNIVISGAKAAFAIIDPADLPSGLSYLGDILSDVASDGASGLIEGIGNLISSGTHSDGQKVDLAITLNTQTTGSSTASGAILTNYGITMPGTVDATSASGYVPADNRKMGVFNLPVRPVVKVHSTNTSGHICSDVVANHYFTYTAQLDAATLAYLNKTNSNSFNQELFGGSTPAATTGTIHYDILGPGTYEGACGGDYEEIAGVYLTNWNNGEKGISTFNTSWAMYVRVYFDVIPTDGSPKTTFVRTFRANATTF